MGVGSGGQGGHAPWIFKHGTDIFGIFFRCPPPLERGLIVLFFAIFWVFLPLAPSWKIFCRRP